MREIPIKDDEDVVKCLMCGVKESYLLDLANQVSVPSPEILNSIKRLDSLLKTTPVTCNTEEEDNEKLKNLMTGVGVQYLLDLSNSEPIISEHQPPNHIRPWVIFCKTRKRAELIKNKKRIIMLLLKATFCLYGEKEFFMLLPHIISFIEKIDESKKCKYDGTLTFSPEERKLLNALVLNSLVEEVNWKEYLLLLAHAMLLVGMYFIDKR
jgi:hypothetical protein